MNIDLVPEGKDVYTCGTVHYYETQFDRTNPKASKKLEQDSEKSFYKVSTSDDTMMAKLHGDSAHSAVKVFATDDILAVIMAAPRSSFSWDLVVNRVGDKLFLDKRSDCSTDYVTNMETANDFGDEEKDGLNHPFKLMQEATYINQAFSQQVLSKTEKPIEFEEPRGPFATDDEKPALSASSSSSSSASASSVPAPVTPGGAPGAEEDCPELQELLAIQEELKRLTRRCQQESEAREKAELLLAAEMQARCTSPAQMQTSPAEMKSRSGAAPQTPPSSAAGKRTRKVGGYDETTGRRKKQRKSTGYMVREATGRGARKRDRVTMGEQCMDRVVEGKYEWRDAGLRPKRRRDPGKEDSGRPPGRQRTE